MSIPRKFELPVPERPKAYPDLLKLRQITDAKLRPCKHLSPDLHLRYYQIIGIMHLLKMTRMVLGDGTGLGKTIVLLGTYAYLLEHDPTTKLVVVCPKSATSQWVDEFAKFTSGIHVKRLENNGPTSRIRQYEEFWRDPGRHVLVMHYHWLREDYRLYEQYLGGSKYILTLDEVTACKNHTSKTHQAARQVSDKAARCYGLTATLLKNNLLEGFGTYKVIYPPLFKNVTTFKGHYCVEKKQEFGGRKIPIVVGYKHVDHFRDLIDPYFLGRNKYDVSDELPELITKEIECGLSPGQLDAYTSALDGLLTVQGEDKETTPLTQIGYCQQIVDSPSILGIDAPSEKEAELFRLMEEELVGEKVIIFSRYKKMVDRLEGLFEGAGTNVTRITGDEDEHQRTLAKLMFQEDLEAIKRWAKTYLSDAPVSTQRQVANSCKSLLRRLRTRDYPNVMLLTPAGTEAINLQAASTFIFYDSPWSPGDYDQLLGRMIRIGSKHTSVLAIHLVCKGTVDDHVMQILKSKYRIIKKVLGEQTKGSLQFETESDINEILSRLKADAIRLRQGGKKALVA